MDFQCACPHKPSTRRAGCMRQELDKLTAGNHPPVVLVSPQIRAGFKQMTVGQLPRLVVLSYDEITQDTQIESVAFVSDGASR